MLTLAFYHAAAASTSFRTSGSIVNSTPKDGDGVCPTRTVTLRGNFLVRFTCLFAGVWVLGCAHTKLGRWAVILESTERRSLLPLVFGGEVTKTVEEIPSKRNDEKYRL